MSIICPYCATENHENALACMSCGAPFSVQTSGYYLSAGSSLQQGKYKIETLIGEGGFGITYRGIDLVNSRTVAIKENWPEKASRQGTTVVWPHTVTPKIKDWQLKKVATEAQYLSQCQHPNIVRVYDYFQENSTAYVVMDFITGKPLSKILEEEGPLPVQRVKRYLLQLLAALTIVHGAKLLHRDIKPENILIDGQDRAILIDFGATKEFIAGQTRQMSITLTRGYAPLEQYSYKAKRWPATDIYALCASMYELLTGQLPPEATERIQSDTLTPPGQLIPGIDPVLDRVIVTGMKMRVEERWQTAVEIIDLLTKNSTVKLTNNSITCPACITENSESASFCTACGSSLTSASTISSSSDHLPAGTLLKQGHYQIEKTLGEGGFGITYKATDLTSSVNVAIKELWPYKAIRQGTSISWPDAITLQSKQQQLSNFQIEAHYLSKCVHPNIAKVYDWFEENNTAYIVMELISGKSLYQILQDDQPLLEERVKRYMIQIAEGLKVVHSHNLLHRGIKPDNILIDDRDRAVLIDFGEAREFIPGITSKMDVTLTPGYAPLEQYSYNAKRWPATDIYALCASMYELLTGQLPAGATDRIPSETLVPPRQLRPDLSPFIEQIILTGMRMKVEERFQTADELIKVLRGSSVTPKLIPLKSVGFIREIFLDKNRLVVGRSEPGGELPDIDLDSFPDANTVSRPHAGIYQEAGEWKVTDLGSANGTFIKRAGQSRFGNRITAPEILNSGDEIAFGKVRFRFENI
ncbi:MAG: FHA domain-containing serine/threonine-protein kinase [Microcoleus anatoxicus]